MEEMFILFPARIGGLDLPEEVSKAIFKAFKNELNANNVDFKEISDNLISHFPYQMGLIMKNVEERAIIQLAINQSLLEFWKIKELGSQVITTKLTLGHLHVLQANDNSTQIEVSYFNKFKDDFSIPMKSKLITINSSFGNPTINDSVPSSNFNHK